MFERYLGILLIIGLTFFAKNFWQTPQVLGDSTPPPTETLPVNQPITTKSSFLEKLQEESEVITKKTIYQDDSEIEAGEEKVLEEGENGKKVKIIKITYSNDSKEYAREIISVETIPAKDKKILRGTKVVWKTLTTADGEIKYWKKLLAWATHYDQYCDGCNEWTAIGMRAGYGVIAVDPKIIPLRSKLYIPGYGKAVAGDTGGNIKENIIDLGFENTKTSGWRNKYVDVYFTEI